MKITLESAIKPIPPICISSKITSLPIKLQWVAVTTVTKPVTHTHVVAVNMASENDVVCPGAVHNGFLFFYKPTKITPAKLRVIICAVFSLCNLYCRF